MANEHFSKWLTFVDTTPTVATKDLHHLIAGFLKTHVLPADAEKDGGYRKLGDVLRAIGTVVEDLQEEAANKVKEGTKAYEIRRQLFLEPMVSFRVWENLKFCLFRAAIVNLAEPSSRHGVSGGQLKSKLAAEGELKRLWTQQNDFGKFAVEVQRTFGPAMAYSVALKKVFQVRAGGMSVPEYATQFRNMLTTLAQTAAPSLDKAKDIKALIARRLAQLVDEDGLLCFLWFVAGVNDEQFLRETQAWLNSTERREEHVTFAHFAELIDTHSPDLTEGLRKFCEGQPDARRLKLAGGRGGPPRMGLAAVGAAGRGRGKGRGRGNTRKGRGGDRDLSPIQDTSLAMAALRLKKVPRAADRGTVDPVHEYPGGDKTFRMVCYSCGYRGHFASVCKRVPPPKASKAGVASLVSNAPGAEEINPYSALVEYDSENEHDAGASSGSEDEAAAAAEASLAGLKGWQVSKWLGMAPTREQRAALFSKMSAEDFVAETSGGGGASSGDGRKVGFAPLSAAFVLPAAEAAGAAAVAAVGAALPPFAGWPVTPGVEDTASPDAVIGGQDVVKVYLAGSPTNTVPRIAGGGERHSTENEVLEMFALKMLVDSGAQSCVMLGAVADVLLAELGVRYTRWSRGAVVEALVDENPAAPIDITTGSGVWRSTRRIHAAVRMHDLEGAPGPGSARSCVPVTFVVVDNDRFQLPGGQFAILGAPFIKAFHSFVVEEQCLRFVTQGGAPHVCLWKYTPARTSASSAVAADPPSATDHLREAGDVARDDVGREMAADTGKPLPDEGYGGEPWSGGYGPLSANKGAPAYTGYGAGEGAAVAAGAGAGAAGGEAEMVEAGAPPPADF